MQKKEKNIFLPYRIEEALERAIVVASNEKKENQVVMADGGHIDLIDDIDENGTMTVKYNGYKERTR